MPHIAIISGTIPLIKEGQTRRVSTPFGGVDLILNDQCVFLPRHGVEQNRHILPHRINHPAHFFALKSLGVSKVIAINSTGSLKRSFKPGTLLVPDDFIFLGPNPTVFGDECRHVTPRLDDEIRGILVQAAHACGGEVTERGIYWQTWGPRFETRAEIRFMSQWADVVGMTMASEAILASELDLPYGAICSIDNYANGILEKPLSMEEVIAGAKKNAQLMERIVNFIIEREK